MEPTVYADVIGNIAINNGMVRMDLYEEALPGPAGTAPGSGRDEPARYMFSRRLVMPLAGFVQSFPLMFDLIKKLEEHGAIEVTPKGPKNK